MRHVRLRTSSADAAAARRQQRRPGAGATELMFVSHGGPLPLQSSRRLEITSHHIAEASSIRRCTGKSALHDGALRVHGR